MEKPHVSISGYKPPRCRAPQSKALSLCSTKPAPVAGEGDKQYQRHCPSFRWEGPGHPWQPAKGSHGCLWPQGVFSSAWLQEEPQIGTRGHPTACLRPQLIGVAGGTSVPLDPGVPLCPICPQHRFFLSTLNAYWVFRRSFFPPRPEGEWNYTEQKATLGDPLENKGAGFRSVEICRVLTYRVSPEDPLCPTSFSPESRGPSASERACLLVFPELS